ncbi:MAG TPA: toprim domain-containing protein [bacterium]|nr:toprim domain-containing protein [bacterium]
MDHGIIRQLVRSLRALPGVNQRQAERIAFTLLQDRTARAALDEIVSTLSLTDPCPRCGWFIEREQPCANCGGEHSVICVVENFSDLLGIERTGQFAGSYHLLGGLIAPLEGTLPEDLNAEPLRERVEAGGIAEVILALPATIEGEATIHYLHELLAPTGVTLTRIARGIPSGSKVEYLDRKTVGNAIAERVKVSSGLSE